MTGEDLPDDLPTVKLLPEDIREEDDEEEENVDEEENEAEDKENDIKKSIPLDADDDEIIRHYNLEEYEEEGRIHTYNVLLYVQGKLFLNRNLINLISF